MIAPLPPGLRVHLDPWVRRQGRVLMGGEPYAVLDLSPTHAALLDGWLAGEPVGPGGFDQGFARNLVSRGILVPGPTGSRPRVVEAVVPVRDGAETLRATLVALTAAGLPVVVVDDGSTDPRAQAAVAADVGARFVARPHSGGPAAARNTGVRALGEPDADVDIDVPDGERIVVFVDADCVPQGDWLDTLLAPFADPQVGAVAPRIVGSATTSTGWVGGYQAERSAADRGDLPGLVRPGGRVPLVPTATLLVRASAFAAVGGFDEAMTGGEDVDLVWRLVAAGWDVRFEPSVRVTHENPVRVTDWVRKRFSYGRSAADLAVRHPRSGGPLAVSPWTAAAWSVVLVLPLGVGIPLGAAITATAAGLLARDLRDLRGSGLRDPVGEAVQLAGLGTLGAGRAVADAVVRSWWPGVLGFAVLPGVPRSVRRRLLGTFTLSAGWSAYSTYRAADGGREPAQALSWMAAKLVDDLAYGAGVWWGSLRRRTPAALLPDLGWAMEVRSARDLVPPPAPSGV